MIANLAGKVRAGVRSDLAKSSFMVFIALILASALNYGFYLVIGHTLTVAAYGTVMSLISVFSLATTPAAIAQTIVAKVVAQHAARGSRRIPYTIARRTFLVGVASALAIVLAGVLLQGPIAAYLRLERAEYVIVTAIATSLGVLLFVGRGLLQGAQLFRAFAISNVLDGFLRFVLALLLAVRLGIDGALLAIAVAVATAVGFGGYVALRSTASAGEPDPAPAAKIPSAVIPTGIISFAMIGLGFYDPILVKHYLQPADAGVYGVVALAGRTVAIVLSFVPIILLPQVTERTMNGHSSRGMLGVAIGLSVVVAATATLVCEIFAPFVVRLLAGASFAAAVPLLAMYVAASSLLAIANVLAAYLIGKHDYRVVIPLAAAGASELALVVCRHANVLEVVQDVFAGHGAVASVMLVAVLLRLLRSDKSPSMKLAV